MKANLFFTAACLLIVLGCGGKTDPSAERQKELGRILKPYLRPGVLEEDYEIAPGWTEEINRAALESFVKNHPVTEEGYEAEIWLSFGLPLQLHRGNLQLADRLNVISERTTNSAIARMAKLERLSVLFEENTNDHSAFEAQANQILAHIKEFEAEKGKAFLRYLKLTGSRLSEIEPTVRELMVVEKRYSHQWDAGLQLAAELRRKFPNWETRMVAADIWMLEQAKKNISLPTNYPSNSPSYR